MIDLSRTTGEQLFFRLLTAPDGLGVKAIPPHFKTSTSGSVSPHTQPLTTPGYASRKSKRSTKMIDLSRTAGEQLFFRLLTAPDGLGVKAIPPHFKTSTSGSVSPHTQPLTTPGYASRKSKRSTKMIDLSRTTGEQLFFRLLTAPDGLGVKAIPPHFKDLKGSPPFFSPHGLRVKAIFHPDNPWIR